MADRNASGVVLLNGNNYPTWKLQCRMSLMKHGAWGFVTGTEEEPEEGDHAGWRKFNDRRDKALASIVLAVEPALLYLLGDPQDPAEVWKKLSEQFEKKSWANKLALRRKLYSLKLNENESVHNHIKSMMEIFEALSVIGYVVEEEDRVVQLLATLPDSFRMLVTALEANPEVPRLEVVTERLLHEEKKIKEKLEKSKPPEDALLVRSRTSGPVCFFCGQIGHIKKFCDEWKKKQNEEQQKKKDQEVANFSQRIDYDSDVECIALVSELKNIEKKWIVDSAASKHLCNDKQNMKDLRRLRYPQYVKVGNGESVEARYEGSVKLQVNSGSRIRPVKLHHVLYVPDLKYNLLSVSKSAELGKKVEFERSGCKIVDIGTGEVVARASKKGQLYYLDCCSSQGRQDQTKKLSAKQEMEKALLSVRENNFQEQMLKRLNSIEEDKNNMELRLKKFEEISRIRESYSFEEENCQNQVNTQKVISENGAENLVKEIYIEESYSGVIETKDRLYQFSETDDDESEAEYDQESEPEENFEESSRNLNYDEFEVEDIYERTSEDSYKGVKEVCNEMSSDVEVQKDNKIQMIINDDENTPLVDIQEDRNSCKHNDLIRHCEETPLTPLIRQGFRNRIKTQISKLTRRSVAKLLRRKNEASV